MRTCAILALLFCCATMALTTGEPILITRLQPFIIDPRASERPDHRKFLVEVFSRSGTNWVKFEKDNILIPLVDFKSVPDGPAILVLKTVFSDGDESEAIAIEIDIRRNRPAPTGKSIALTEEEAKAKTFNDLIFIRRMERAAKHPAPAPAGAVTVVAHPTSPPPIPDSTNRHYSTLLRRNE